MIHIILIVGCLGCLYWDIMQILLIRLGTECIGLLLVEYKNQANGLLTVHKMWI